LARSGSRVLTPFLATQRTAWEPLEFTSARLPPAILHRGAHATDRARVSKRGMLGYTGLCIPTTEWALTPLTAGNTRLLDVRIWTAVPRYTDQARCVTRII